MRNSEVDKTCTRCGLSWPAYASSDIEHLPIATMVEQWESVTGAKMADEYPEFDVGPCMTGNHDFQPDSEVADETP